MTTSKDHASAFSYRRPHILMASLLFVALTVIGITAVSVVELDRRADESKGLNSSASLVASSLERQLKQSLSATAILASIIRQSEDHLILDFDTIAAELIEAYGAIDSLQLAPRGIVSQIYPLKGNERAIGHDLLNDPTRRTEALAAIESRGMTLAGPFELIQGGTAVIGRLPVFVPGDQGGERFWGFSIALIRLSNLLAATDLAMVEEQSQEFWLSRVDPNTGQPDVFASSAEGDIQDSATFSIEVPNGSWDLNLRSSDNRTGLWFASKISLVILFSSIASLLVYILSRRAIERKFAQQALEREINERSRLEAGELELVKELSVVDEVARIVTNTLDIDEVYGEFATEVKKLVDFDRMSISLWDRDAGVFTMKHTVGEAVPGQAVGDTVRLDGTPTRVAIDEGRTVLLSDTADGQYTTDQRFLKAGLRSTILVPLSYRGNAIGGMALGSKNIGAYGLKDQVIMERLAGQIAPAMINSQLYQTSTRLALESQLMAEIGQVVSSSLEIEEVYERFAELVQSILPFDLMHINTLDVRNSTLTTLVHVSGIEIPGRTVGTTYPLEGTFSERVIQSPKGLIFQPDDSNQQGKTPPGLTPFIQAGTQTLLGVPLTSNGKVIAVLNLTSALPQAYSVGDLGLAMAIGQQIAGPVANARLYAEIKSAKDAVKTSLREKEVLLQEINHRVKNNLQIISSLLSLQSRDIQDEQALRSFQVSQDRIRAMALVHEKLYQSDDLARIDIGEYVKSLADDLRSSYGLSLQDVKLTIDVDNILLGVDIAIPCGVIVNELVSNSLKHAFPERRPGEITISFREVDGQYTMIFKDDGVGLPENMDLMHPSSLGLTIVNALTGQLGGAIDLGHNGGTEICITFPARQTKGD